MDHRTRQRRSLLGGNLGVTAVLCLLVAACEARPPSKPISDTISFTLACEGREEVSINRAPATVSPRVSGTFITWDAASGELYTGQPVSDEPFCVGPAQEECNVAITPGKLSAKQLDLAPGKAPNAVASYEQNLEVDLATMTGTSFVRSTSGTLTDTAAEVHFRTEVKKPLTCKRAGFTPPGSPSLQD
jgi:hypothetical protein